MPRTPSSASTTNPAHPLVSLFFILVLLGAGLFLGTQGTLILHRTPGSAPVATQAWRFADAVTLLKRSVENVTDARIVRRELTAQEERSTAYRNALGGLSVPENLQITGDTPMDWPYHEDLSLIRGFLRNHAAKELSVAHPVDIRRTVAAWICLALGGISLLGWIWNGVRKLTGAPTPRRPSGSGPMPLPQNVGAALLLAAVTAVGLFFWKGHIYFGPLAVSKVAALQTAAKNNDAAGIDAAAKRGVWIDARDGQQATALHMAARAGAAQAVDALLKTGANVGVTDLDGRTPLTVAIQSNQTEIALKLLAAGTDVTIVDGNARTALHHAAAGGNATVVQHLISAGADVNEPDVQGWTPLFHAVTSGSAETVKALLQAGADPKIKATDGRVAADVAILHPALRDLLK